MHERTARKQELRELVESNEAQVDHLRKQVEALEKRASESEAALQVATKQLDRALPFEKEVKEKNLLIGKLRHEAVILNDHLTKALRFLKRGKPEDNIDRYEHVRGCAGVWADQFRHIVTNHFLHFLALDRSDPKKFQVLQLIAALLKWTDGMRTFFCRRPDTPDSVCRATRASRSRSTGRLEHIPAHANLGLQPHAEHARADV